MCGACGGALMDTDSSISRDSVTVPERPAKPAQRPGRSVASATAVYAAVTIVQRGLPLLLLPIYTRALTPAEYGELGVLIALGIGLAYLLSFGQELSLFRKLFQTGTESDERRRLLETAANLLLVVPLGAAAMLAIPGVLVGYRWLNVDPLDLALVLLNSALFVSNTVLPFTVLRAEERLRDFIRLNTVLTVMTTAFTVAFVVWFDWGVTGWYSGAIVATLATWTWTVRILPWPWSLKLHRDHLRALLRIGLPLIPHQFSLWGLQLANRVLLVGLVTKAQVAVFTLATTLALPVTLLAGALVYGVFPSYGRALEDPAQRRALSAIVTVQVTTVVSLGVAVALIAPLFCTLLFPPIYAAAAPIVPLIALGYALGALYAVPLNAAALLAGRTTFAWIATAVAAGANVAVLYAAVPRYGLDGAAAAVCIGNALLFIGTVIYSRLVAPGALDYEWSRLCAALLVLADCYVGAVMTTGDDGAGNLVARLLWLAGAAAVLVRLGIVPSRLGRGQASQVPG